MYGRKYADRELSFEASGGLLHAALVMRDRETGSYWPIMTGKAESGPLSGTRLQELPVGTKVQWKDWVRLHPETEVLSVGGVEHLPSGPYDQYFASDSGFRGLEATDRRLATKEPIWAFELGSRHHAVPFRDFEGGAVFRVGERWIFLHRPRGVSFYFSSRAFVSEGRFIRAGDSWLHEPSGLRFEPEAGVFAGTAAGGPQPLPGFDTFWYIWSLTHPETEVLAAPQVEEARPTSPRP